MLFFWCGYVSFTGYQFYTQASRQAANIGNSRVVNLEYILQSSVGALVQEHPDGLRDKLSQARKLGFIDFYILQEGSQALFFENNTGQVEDLNHNYANFNILMDVDGLKFKTIKVQDYKLTAGVYSNAQATLWETFKNMFPLFIKDIAVVTSFLGFVAYLLLKDIINLSKVLTSRSRKDIRNIKTTSLEAQNLVNASLSLEGERERFEHLSEVYGETVGPAIRHELKSGQNPPYSFGATLCRIDLNGYTQMFLEKDPKYVTSILNQYFAKAREVIERYGGLIYQFVGDEIVFLFKEDLATGLDTDSLAISCIRDLFHEAAIIEKNLPHEANHYFKLKGALAKGSMRFNRLDEGHALSGLPLIESVRLLSLIDDKSHQVLTFFNESSKSADGLAFIFDRQMNQLKGFKEQSLICKSRDFMSVEFIFETKNWGHLSFYRQDEHVLFILKKLRLMASSRQEEDILSILRSLRFHHFTKSTPQIAIEAGLTLNAFVQAEVEQLLSSKSLSSLIAFLGRIIPVELWNQSLEKSLLGLMEHKDPRVKANVIVTLGRYDFTARTLWENMFSENNRVAADTIIEVAKRQLNLDVFNALDRLLTSSDSLYRRSGEFALQSILVFYKETDPVFYKTNPILNKMQVRLEQKIAA